MGRGEKIVCKNSFQTNEEQSCAVGYNANYTDHAMSLF